MATYYWVKTSGGSSTGTWNGTNTGNWSTSSGGSPGAGPPTSADDVIFDAGSDNGVIFTVTVATGAVCRNITASNLDFTMTLAVSANLDVYGSLSFPSTNFSITSFFSINFLSTSTGNTVDFGTSSSINPALVFNGAGGSWLMQRAHTFGSGMTLTAGTLDLNGFDLTLRNIASNNSNVRSIAFGSNRITLTGNGLTIWGFNTATGFTYTGTPDVYSNYSGATGTRNLYHGTTAGATETNSPNFYVTAGSDSVGVGSAKNIVFSGFSGAFVNGTTIYGNLTFNSGMTTTAIANIMSFRATSGIQLVTTAGVLFDFPVTVNAPGATVRLVDSLTVGSTRLTTLTAGTFDLNGNTLSTGTFNSSGSTARTLAFGAGNITITGSGTVWNTATVTNFSYTGTPTVNISNNSATATTVITGTLSEAQSLNFNYTIGTYALTDTSSIYKNLSFSGFGGTVPNSARTIYGNLTLVAGPTYTAGTNATTFAATSGTQSVTTNSQTLDYPITQNNPGATLSLQDNFTLGSTRAYTLTAGTFNVNGKTASVGTFASTGASTRSIAFGTSGNITIVGSGATAWNASGSGLTTTGTTSTISMTSASAKTFVGGGYTYAAALNQGGSGTLTISGSNTFDNITNTYGATGATTITFTAGTTQTVSAFTASGTSGNLLTLNSSSSGTRFNLSDPSGSVNVSFCNISDSNATGGARWNSYLSNGNINGGNNLGWDFSQRGGLSPVPGLSSANGLSLGVGLVGNL